MKIYTVISSTNSIDFIQNNMGYYAAFDKAQARWMTLETKRQHIMNIYNDDRYSDTWENDTEYDDIYCTTYSVEEIEVIL